MMDTTGESARLMLPLSVVPLNLSITVHLSGVNHCFGGIMLSACCELI